MLNSFLLKERRFDTRNASLWFDCESDLRTVYLYSSLFGEHNLIAQPQDLPILGPSVLFLQLTSSRILLFSGISNYFLLCDPFASLERFVNQTRIIYNRFSLILLIVIGFTISSSLFGIFPVKLSFLALPSLVSAPATFFTGKNCKTDKKQDLLKLPYFFGRAVLQTGNSRQSRLHLRHYYFRGVSSFVSGHTFDRFSL